MFEAIKQIWTTPSHIKFLRDESVINIIIDISGSIGASNFQKLKDFVKENIEDRGILMNIIYCDTEVRDHKLVSKMDEVPVNGTGGALLNNAIEYIRTYELDKHNTILFTDGYTDDLDLSNYNKDILWLKPEGSDNNLKIKKLSDISKIFTYEI